MVAVVGLRGQGDLRTRRSGGGRRRARAVAVIADGHRVLGGSIRDEVQLLIVLILDVGIGII